MCEENIVLILMQAVALFLSEILPFVKGSKSNGIAHALYTLMTSGCLHATPSENPAEFHTEISVTGELRETRVENNA